MKSIPPSEFVVVYHPFLRTLHWLMAAMIFVALGLGVWATQLPRGSMRSDVLFVHKSLGVAVLALIVVRVLARLALGSPVYAAALDWMTHAAARSAHLLLYALMIAMPVTGYLTSAAGAEKHEYASDVLDAGAFARFGRVEVYPGSAGYEIWTRSGNVEQPVRGWSDWLPLKDGSVVSPPGRFLQWKAELHKDGALGSVGVNYLPVNSAPVVDDLVVVPGARLNPQVSTPQNQTVNIAFSSPSDGSTATFDTGSSAPLQANRDRSGVTVRWAAHDDDGDDLIYSLYLRGDGETVWRLLKDKITDKAYSFDATSIPDGGYRIKVVASDAPSHTPDDALTSEKVSERFEMDTAPPVITNLKAGGLCAEASVRYQLRQLRRRRCNFADCPRRVLTRRRAVAAYRTRQAFRRESRALRFPSWL